MDAPSLSRRKVLAGAVALAGAPVLAKAAGALPTPAMRPLARNLLMIYDVRSQSSATVEMYGRNAFGEFKLETIVLPDPGYAGDEVAREWFKDAMPERIEVDLPD